MIIVQNVILKYLDNYQKVNVYVKLAIMKIINKYVRNVIQIVILVNKRMSV